MVGERTLYDTLADSVKLSFLLLLKSPVHSIGAPTTTVRHPFFLFLSSGVRRPEFVSPSSFFSKSPVDSIGVQTTTVRHSASTTTARH